LGGIVEQVKRFMYLGVWITENVRCEMEVKARILMAKDAYCRPQELF